MSLELLVDITHLHGVIRKYAKYVVYILLSADTKFILKKNRLYPQFRTDKKENETRVVIVNV